MADRCQERIPLRWLIDSRDGELQPRHLEKLERHLSAGCPSCQVRLAELGRTVDSIEAGPLTAPPAALARRAGALLAKHRRRAAFDRVRRAVARLVFDEWVEPVPALRSVPGRSRRMLFSVGDGEMFLTFTRGTASWRLEGEMLAPVAEVVLRKEGSERARASIGEDGRFSFASVPSGVWSLSGAAKEQPFETPAFVL